ncbi:hypothetical protein HDU96_007459 [Phlyctochytrium bullatum]|nr:hypothetical protein HDU96_007459 [Phlyctochytrium bullatum]
MKKSLFSRVLSSRRPSTSSASSVESGHTGTAAASISRSSNDVDDTSTPAPTIAQVSSPVSATTLSPISFSGSLQVSITGPEGDPATASRSILADDASSMIAGDGSEMDGLEIPEREEDALTENEDESETEVTPPPIAHANPCIFISYCHANSVAALESKNGRLSREEKNQAGRFDPRELADRLKEPEPDQDDVIVFEDDLDPANRVLKTHKERKNIYKVKVKRLPFYAPKSLWASDTDDTMANTADHWQLQDEEEITVSSQDLRFPAGNMSIEKIFSSRTALKPHDSVEVKIFSHNGESYWWFPGTAAVSYAMSNAKAAVRFGFALPTKIESKSPEDIYCYNLLCDKKTGAYIPGADPPPRPVELKYVRNLPAGCERLFEKLRGNEVNNDNVLSPELARSYLRSLQFTREELDIPIYISVPETKTYLYLIKQLNLLGFTILNKVNGYSSATPYQMVLGSCMAILCFKNDYKKHERCLNRFRLLYNLRIPIIPMRMKKRGSDLQKFGRWPFNIHLLLATMKSILSGLARGKGPLIGSQPPPADIGDMSVVLTSRVPPSTEEGIAEPGSVVEVCMPVKVGTRWEPSFPLRLLDKKDTIFCSYAWKTSHLALQNGQSSSVILTDTGAIDPRRVHKCCLWFFQLTRSKDYMLFNKSTTGEDNTVLVQSVISRSQIFISFLSEPYLDSKACMEELQFAMEKKVPILFLLVGTAERAHVDLLELLSAKIAREQWPPKPECIDLRKSSSLKYVKGDIQKVLQSYGLKRKELDSVGSESESVTSGKTGTTALDNGELLERKNSAKDPFDEVNSGVTFWAWVPVVLSQRSGDGRHCRVIGMGTPFDVTWTVETVPDIGGDFWVKADAIRPFQNPSPDLSDLSIGDRVEVRICKYTVEFDRINKPSNVNLITRTRVAARQIRKLTDMKERRTALADRFPKQNVLEKGEFAVAKKTLQFRSACPRSKVTSFPSLKQIAEIADILNKTGSLYNAWKFDAIHKWRDDVSFAEDRFRVEFTSTAHRSEVRVVQSDLPLWFAKVR